jgi:Zn-dependent protease
VSPFPPQLIAICARCAHPLVPRALECDQCHALVHAEQLDQLAKEAKKLESKGELHMARDRWLSGLPLLPRASKQADWIQAHARELESKTNAKLTAPPPENNWAKRLGPVGVLALMLAKAKTILLFAFKLKFLLSLAAFIGVYWTLYGPKFGIGFALLILVHEMGHFVDVKRRGLPAEMPVFLPGFGAYVKWQALGVSLETRAAVSLAGPLAGCIASVACALVWWKTGDPVWAALARSSAWLNVLNLIPVWMLDGGQAAQALGRSERLLLLTGSLALWLVFRENVLILVALGAGYRVFIRDAPSHPSRFILAYYIAVLAALTLVLWMMPGHGFGTR